MRKHLKANHVVMEAMGFHQQAQCPHAITLPENVCEVRRNAMLETAHCFIIATEMAKENYIACRSTTPTN